MQCKGTKTTLVLPTSLPPTTLLFHILASYSFAHDFIHSRALIVSIDRLFQRLVTVNPALEKRRSGSAAMAGIESTLRAILKRLGKSLLCLSSIHHFRMSL